LQIEPDPAFEDYGKRIRAAREKNQDWLREYARTNQQPGFAPLPYHENFGVTKQEYEHFSQPMNQYRIAKRNDIKIRRGSRDGRIQLDFEGEDLLLTQLVLNPADGAVKTPLDELPKGYFLDLETATLPPGRYRGILLRTPDAKIGTTRRRETVLIGELKDQPSGIIHYSLNTPGQVKMSSILFPKAEPK
jgi:hypothetical protein